MEDVIVLRSLNQNDSDGNRYLLKKSATILKCTCKLAYSIVTPKNYFPLFKKLYLQKNFHFVEEDILREALTHDYALAIKNGLQHWFRNHYPQQSFMFETTGPEFNIMSHNCWYGHSGGSFGFCMRILEYIFKNGYYAYYFKYIN